MDALKLLPQSFFDFLARLVPGALALGIFLDSAFGRERWRMLLDALAAGQLSKNNVTTLALVTATIGTYVGGQLAAPFGKAMQRIAESIETILSPPRDEKRWAHIGKALWPRSNKDVKKATGAYDWLRVNAPEIGALAAKIRAEQTMFYSMSAVLLVAAVGEFITCSWPKAAGCAVLGLACEVRGYTVGRTHKQTSDKLRRAVEDRMKTSDVGSFPPPS